MTIRRIGEKYYQQIFLLGIFYLNSDVSTEKRIIR